METGVLRYLSALPEYNAIDYRQRGRTCQKVQLFIASFLLVGGITSMIVGIPKVIEELSNARLKIRGGVDVKDLTFSEHVHLQMDGDDLKTYAILSVAGILSTILSAGFLLGMACRGYHALR